MTSLVIGGSGKVGGYIVKHLAGEPVFAMSRRARVSTDAIWIVGDLQMQMEVPQVEVIYCTANAVMFAAALPKMITRRLKRVVVFTTTSIKTKMDTEIDGERRLFRQFAEAERLIQSICENNGIAWTILRPTLIYDEGKDRNITRLANMIRRVGFMPVVRGANGLRQPVHAEDLAIAAIAAAKSKLAVNRIYDLPGIDTVTFAEMIGRIFDGLGRRRILIPVPAVIWRAIFKIAQPLFPGFNVAMGMRMTQDMTFDAAPAQRDFNWRPRDFRPHF